MDFATYDNIKIIKDKIFNKILKKYLHIEEYGYIIKHGVL